MGRFVHNAFNTAGALLLLMCVMTMALWLASYFVPLTPLGPRLLILRLAEGDDHLILRRGFVEHAILFNGVWYSEGEIPFWAIALGSLISGSSVLLYGRWLRQVSLRRTKGFPID